MMAMISFFTSTNKMSVLLRQCNLLLFVIFWLNQVLASPQSSSVVGQSSNNNTVFSTNRIDKWPPEQPIVINIFRLTSLLVVQPGVLAALDVIRANATLSQAFDFRMDMVGLQRKIGTETSGVLRGMMNAISDANVTYELMLGSDSSTENIALAQLTPVYNLIQFCVFCRSSELSDKSGVYSTLIRDSARSQDMSRVVLELLRLLQVEELATVARNDQAVVDNMREIENALTAAGKKLQYSGVLGYSNMDNVMAALQKVSPTYILAMFLTLPIPKSICELYKRGWRADRVLYIVGGPFQVAEWWQPHDFDEPGTRPWNCTVAEMADAMQGSFFIDIRHNGDATSNTTQRQRPFIGNITSVQLEERMLDYASQLSLPPLFPAGAFHSYDVLWSAVDALWRTGVRMSAPGSNLSLADALADEDNYRTPQKRQFSQIFREEIGKTRFYGASGDYQYDKNYDRLVDLNVAQLQLGSALINTTVTSGNNAAADDSVAAPSTVSITSNVLIPVSVGYFDARRNKVRIDARLFKFATPDNQPPGLWLKIVAEKADEAARVRLAIILAVIGAALLAAIVAAAILLYLKNQERKADTSWLITTDDLTRVQLQRDHHTSLGSLGASHHSLQSLNAASHASTSASSFAVHLPPNRGRASFLDTSGENVGTASVDVWVRIVSVSSGVATTVASLKNNRNHLSRRQKVMLNDLFPQAGALRAVTQHFNLVHFVGLCFDKKDIGKALILYEWASKGPLRRCIANRNFVLDGDLKSSFMYDIASGLQFMHGKYSLTFGGSHGFLHTDNVVLDSKFTAKLTDYGFWKYRPPTDFEPVSAAMLENVATKKLELLLFRAPEFLRKGVTQMDAKMIGKRTKTRSALVSEQLDELHHADIYSFGMVIVELYTRRPPYLYTEDDPSRESLESLLSFISGVSIGGNRTFAFGQVPALLAPYAETNMSDQLASLILECVHAIPAARPVIGEVLRRIRKIPGFSTASVIENLIDKLHSYAANLEGVVAERTKALADEMARSDELLAQILPRTVAEELKRGQAVPPESFEVVSVYFSDIVGFTALSSESTPMQVVLMLNGLYTMFDSVLENYDVYKVETIGDAYMVASGLPIRNGNRHLSEISYMSLNLLETIAGFVITHRPGQQLNLRIGLHTGPCVAGVVGIKMPRYCLFGDTINMASRMESTGEPRRIHISEDFKKQLQAKFGDSFIMQERGETMVKGKGILNTAWLTGSTSSRFRTAQVSKDSFESIVPVRPTPSPVALATTAPPHKAFHHISSASSSWRKAAVAATRDSKKRMSQPAFVNASFNSENNIL